MGKKLPADTGALEQVSDESREEAQTQAIEATSQAVLAINEELDTVRERVAKLEAPSEPRALISDGLSGALAAGLASLAHRLETRVSLLAEENKYLQAQNEFHRTGKPLPITDEMLALLKEPLPPEAVKPHPDNADLSSIKTIYIIERLNEVFGVAGWSYKSDIIEGHPDHAQIVVKVTLSIPKYGITHEAFGGNQMKDRGDAYKGAVTDAISKIGSMLYIGMDVYKGSGPTKTNGGRRTPPRATATTSAITPQGKPEETIPPCQDCKEVIKTLEVKGDSYTPAQLVANSRKVWRSKPQVSDSPHDGPALCGSCQRARRKAEGTKTVQPPAPLAPPSPEVAIPNGTAAPIR